MPPRPASSRCSSRTTSTRRQDAYLEAIAEAMRAEYEAIVGAGFLLQIDAPDLGMGRHTMYRNASVGRIPEPRPTARRGAEPRAAQRAGRPRAHALAGATTKGRITTTCRCEQLLPVRDQGEAAGAAVRGGQSAARARVDGVPATAGAGRQDPDPGRAQFDDQLRRAPASSSPSGSLRFADIVGRERVIAGTDCGFGTFARLRPGRSRTSST